MSAGSAETPSLEPTTTVLDGKPIPTEGFGLFKPKAAAAAPPAPADLSPPPPEDGEPAPAEPASVDTAPAVADLPPPSPPDARAEEDLARRDRELWQRETALRAQEHELQQLRTVRQRLAADPLAALSELGVSQQQLVDAMVRGAKGGDPEPVQALDSIKQELAEVKRELRASREQQTVAGEQGKIASIVQTLPDTPILARLSKEENSNVVGDLWRRCITYHQQTGRIPDYREVARAAEKEYAGQIVASLRSLIDVPTVRDELTRLLGPEKTQQAAQKPTTPAAGAQKQPPKTLSGDLQGQEPKTVRKPLTDAEAEAEFIRVMREKGWRKDS